MAQYVCANCLAANLIPEGRPPLAAKCEHCHQRLFSGHPLEVSGQDLAAHRAGTKGAAILLNIWAPDFGPCRPMAHKFAIAASRLGPLVRFLAMNSKIEPRVTKELGVSRFPTLLLFDDGKILARTAGFMSVNFIVAWTRQALAQANAARLDLLS